MNKILIIDDDEMIRKALSATFKDAGFIVMTAEDGGLGLTDAIKTEPDVIITDIEMGDVDGMNVLKEVRARGEWGEMVPVVILTNFNPDDKIMEHILKDRPSLFLAKSKITPKEILEKINDLLKNNIKNETQNFK